MYRLLVYGIGVNKYQAYHTGSISYRQYHKSLQLLTYLYIGVLHIRYLIIGHDICDIQWYHLISKILPTVYS